MTTTLLYRATCPRCLVIAYVLRMAMLCAVPLDPLPRARADALADATGSRGKLLVRRTGQVLSGPPAALALIRASALRWSIVLAIAVVFGMMSR